MKFLVDKFLRCRNPIKYWRNKGLIIGDGCEVYSSASFGSEPYLIKIGNNVRINSGVNFFTHDGGCWVLRHCLNEEKCEQIDMFGVINVGNNVHIGTNSIIMPGVNIGDNVIIGCCSVVTKNIPSNSIAVGIPAKVIETINEYSEKHKNDFVYTKHLSYNEKKEFLIKKYRCNNNEK